MKNFMKFLSILFLVSVVTLSVGLPIAAAEIDSEDQEIQEMINQIKQDDPQLYDQIMSGETSYEEIVADAANNSNGELPTPETVIAKARILKTLNVEEVTDPLSGEPTLNQKFWVKIISGEYKNRELVAYNYQSSNPVYNIEVSDNDQVLVMLERNAKGELGSAYVADYLRETKIMWTLVLFVILVLAIGWKHGAKSICALLLTMLLIWFVLLPGILNGNSPILLAILTAALSTLITILVVGGWSRKSFAAIIGTIGGVAISGFLALLVGHSAHLTGFGTEAAAMLLYIPQSVSLDVKGILYAGIIIGALGAAMDVSISVASSINEIHRHNSQLSFKELVSSGLNVGRDIIGTMTNTLILAYTGSSLPLILIFMAYNESFAKVINLDMVASEVLRALFGSIGLVLVVPFTAFAAAWLMSKDKKSSETNETIN